MFGWVRRRALRHFTNVQREELEAFVLGLRGAADGELGMVVAMAAHWRNILRRDGVDLLTPLLAGQQDIWLASRLNRLIRQLQKKGRADMAAGLMVWLHSVRAASDPLLRLAGRSMWTELLRGFPFAERAAIDFASIGIQIDASGPQRVPLGLEPHNREGAQKG